MFGLLNRAAKRRERALELALQFADLSVNYERLGSDDITRLALIFDVWMTEGVILTATDLADHDEPAASKH